MIRLASTEIGKTGEVLAVFRPEPHYLQGVLPVQGVNILNWGDDETKASIKQFVDYIFQVRNPIELELTIINFSIQLTAHAPKGDTAFIYWKELNPDNTKKNAVKEDWGFDELPLQKRLDIEIPRTEHNLKRFTDNLPLVVFEIFLFPDGRFEFGFVNKEMQTFFPGFNREAVNADNSLLFVRVHPEDKSKLLDSIKNVFKFNVWDIEYRIVENGEIRWVKGFGRPEVGGNGDKITVCTYLRDITEKKLLDEKLNNERALLRTLIDNLPNAVFAKDTLGRKILSNKLDLKYMGVSSDAEVIGKTDLEIFNNERGKVGYAEDIEVIETGNPLLLKEGQLIHEGELREIVISKIPLLDDNGNVNGLVGICRDVTDEKRVEHNLKLVDFTFRHSSTPILLIKEEKKSGQARR